MKYGKGTCVECGRSIMTTDDGRAITHPSLDGAGNCDGSAELTEQATREATKPKPMPPTPVVTSTPVVAPAPKEEATPFTIEKGIPIPKVRTGKMGRFRRQLLAMQVGDSFACSNSGKRAAEAAIRDAAKKAGVKITMRRLEADVVRVWRIE